MLSKAENKYAITILPWILYWYFFDTKENDCSYSQDNLYVYFFLSKWFWKARNNKSLCSIIYYSSIRYKEEKAWVLFITYNSDNFHTSLHKKKCRNGNDNFEGLNNYFWLNPYYLDQVTDGTREFKHCNYKGTGQVEASLKLTLTLNPKQKWRKKKPFKKLTPSFDPSSIKSLGVIEKKNVVWESNFAR